MRRSAHARARTRSTCETWSSESRSNASPRTPASGCANWWPTGEELPYDVTAPGEGSPFAQFAPQTTRFIRAHATALLDLDSFGPACSAIASAEIARSYLERLGEPVPNDPGRSAADAVVTFLCRVWEGSAEFPLDAARIEAALGELEDTERAAARRGRGSRPRARASDADLAPRARVGVAGARRDDRGPAGGAQRRGRPAKRMGAALLRRRPAPHRAARRKTARAPARRCASWSPRCACSSPAASGWARTPGRAAPATAGGRISTGAGRPRGGSYWLTGSELSDLVDFSTPPPGSRRVRRWRARSRASRPASSGRRCSTRSATTCSRCEWCSRAAAPPASSFRCAPRRCAPRARTETGSSSRSSARARWRRRSSPATRLERRGRVPARAGGRGREPRALDPARRRARTPRRRPARGGGRDVCSPTASRPARAPRRCAAPRPSGAPSTASPDRCGRPSPRPPGSPRSPRQRR